MKKNATNCINKTEELDFEEMYDRTLNVEAIDHKILDIPYGNNERNRLDLFYPAEEKEKYPLIVFFHGGALIKGDKRRYQLKPALNGINKGYVVASVNYRLIQHAPYPAFNEDAIQALRYLKENAEKYRIDGNHICVWGESAGAYLAMVAGFSQEVQVVIDWYGYTDFAKVEFANQKGNEFTQIAKAASTLNEATFNEKGIKLEELMKEARIENYIREKIPAVFIEHGTSDPLIPYQQSKDLYEDLRKKIDERSELHLVEGGVHGVEGYSNKENLDLVFGFIDKWI